MKKFRFSLQKLMEYKEQLLDGEKNVLNLMQHERNLLDKHILSLQNMYNISRENYKKLSEKGATILEITVQQQHIREIQRKIEEQQNVLAMQDKKIEHQTKVIVSLNTEISSLNKLKDKQFADYKYKLQKQEELLIEEFVSNTSASNSDSD